MTVKKRKTRAFTKYTKLFKFIFHIMTHTTNVLYKKHSSLLALLLTETVIEHEQYIEPIHACTDKFFNWDTNDYCHTFP